MKAYTFKVTVEPDFFEDGTPAYHAYAPALKGAATWGYTREEALRNIQEVIQMVVESMVEHQEPLPEGQAGWTEAELRCLRRIK